MKTSLLSFVLAALSAACSGPCDTLLSTGSSSAALTVSPSADLLAILHDAGVADAEIAWKDPQAQPIDSLQTHVARPLPTAPPDVRCVAVDTLGAPVRIGFDCPTAPGMYSLEGLHAIACDTVCGPLFGTLSVTAIRLPCAEGGCGRLEADLDLPGGSGVGPSVAGTAHLSYSESVYHHACYSSLSDG